MMTPHIKIKRGGREYGPYARDLVQSYLSSGNIAPTDLGCWEGHAQWMPVSRLLTSSTPNTPTTGAQSPPPPYSPVPPSLHWLLVALFGVISGGLFTVIWIFVQASYAKKIDSSNKASLLYGLSITCYVLCIVAVVAAGAAGSSGDGDASMAALLSGVAIVVILVGIVLFHVGTFSIRASLQKYYRNVDPIGFTQGGEPIGIRLSGAMTFFFNVYYIQYHLTRIARWKETGVLP
jgi:hypothetical protein